MAPPPLNPHLDPDRTPVGFDLGGYRFPARLTDPTSAASRLLVKTHTIRQIVVIEVTGWLCDIVEELDWAIQLALASGPRGVACDLSAVGGGSDSRALELLATAGRHVRDWHGTPVAFAIPDPRVRDALSAYPLAGPLIVKKSLLASLYAVLRTPAPKVEWLRVLPHPTSPRASREFVTQTLISWRLAKSVPSACLVVSELVTNSTLHGGTSQDIDVSLAWNGRALRLTVRDHSPELPRQHHEDLELHGRGLAIVAGVSRAFGVLPTADGGKVVWAVLDAAGPDPSITQVSAEPEPDPATATTSQEPPRPSGRGIVPEPTGRPRPRTSGEASATTRRGSAGDAVLATRSTSPRQVPHRGGARVTASRGGGTRHTRKPPGR